MFPSLIGSIEIIYRRGGGGASSGFPSLIGSIEMDSKRPMYFACFQFPSLIGSIEIIAPAKIAPAVFPVSIPYRKYRN